MKIIVHFKLEHGASQQKKDRILEEIQDAAYLHSLDGSFEELDEMTIVLKIDKVANYNKFVRELLEIKTNQAPKMKYIVGQMSRLYLSGWSIA